MGRGLGASNLVVKRSNKSWKPWCFAAIINLAAAVVAALAFGAWKRSQSSPSEANVPDMGAGFYEMVDDVGYVQRANARVRGRTTYNTIYTTGPDGFRVVPEAVEKPDACVLSFGASFTFGNGVSDDETYTAQIVRLSGGRVAARNFGVSGWGPHQFLAGLQSGRFQRAARCRPTDAVFLMVPSLIWWASGVTNPWDTNGPHYRQGADGRAVRDGVLGDSQPYNWRQWIGLDSASKGDAMRLAAAVIAEAMSELRRSYPSIRTHRVASWSDAGFRPDDMVGFEYHLHQAGVMPLPLEAIIPRYRFAQRDYVLSPTDYHPNARAHRLIAEFILRQIGSDH
jgi:hypothetical protein